MKKLTIITGGSSGLGLAIAKQLIHENLLLIARDYKKLETIKKELMALNASRQVVIEAISVSDEAKVKDLFRKIKNDYQVENLINCAGLGIFGPVDSIDKGLIERVIEANLIGLILMSKEALMAMRQHGGKLVNIMSTAARVGKVNESIYCASKWGARGFTESLKATYKGSNIDIVGVYPGGMRTPFWSDDQNIDHFMDPEEVAKQVVYVLNTSNNLYVSDIVIERK